MLVCVGGGVRGGRVCEGESRQVAVGDAGVLDVCGGRGWAGEAAG